METIRNFLASMFANLPNTPQVQRARAELDQMMEDKYHELLQEGRTENEAVAVVISEFGNLDELAESLGIQNAVQSRVMLGGRTMSRDEVQRYIQQKERATLLRSIAIFLCIISTTPFLLAGMFVEGVGFKENLPIGLATGAFFLLIAVAVGLFVFAATRMKEWDYLKRENVVIDQATAEYLHGQREANRFGYAIMKTIGVLLCIACIIPVSVMSILGAPAIVAPFIGTVLFFVMLGIGVMLLTSASGKEKAYLSLLKLNDRNTISGHYVSSQGEERYTNDTIATIMDVFWPTVLAIYLCWSFLSFDWHITWIIWPIAALVKYWMRTIWAEKKG